MYHTSIPIGIGIGPRQCTRIRQVTVVILESNCWYVIKYVTEAVEKYAVGQGFQLIQFQSRLPESTSTAEGKNRHVNILEGDLPEPVHFSPIINQLFDYSQNRCVLGTSTYILDTLPLCAGVSWGRSVHRLCFFCKIKPWGAYLQRVFVSACWSFKVWTEWVVRSFHVRQRSNNYKSTTKSRLIL